MKGFFTYPLENQDDYKGKMIFQVVNEAAERNIQIDYGGFAGSVISAAAETVATVAEAGLTAIGTGIAQATGIGSTPGSFAFNRTGNEYKGASKELTALTDRKVTLYLPQAIQIQDAATYDNNVELGAIGGGIMNAAENNRNNFNIGNAISSATTSINNTIKALSRGDVTAISQEQASIASQMLLKNAGATGASAGLALGAITGVTANPNLRTLFRSVPIRNFSFTFTLMPSSQREAEQIRSIVQFFREELYPEALSVGGIDYGYKFPNRMLIKMIYKDREIPGIKFLPVYLQNFNAVYNPNGMGMHKDGNWSEVQITMTFTETKPLAKQDIERGY